MFTYKEVVFYLACCTVCNNITLFSLFSFTICLALFSTTPFPLLSLLFVVLCNGHTVAHHTNFLFFFILFLTFHHRSSVLSPFLPFLSVSLSVMAYQDGFYGAADLYVSIYISTLLPHSCFPPVACGFSSVKWQRTNP